MSLTLFPHARLLALAQPAFLALSTHVHVHFTPASIFADILGTLDNTAAEEALAAFTTQHIIVEARGPIPTYTAQLISEHLGRWPFLPF